MFLTENCPGALTAAKMSVVVPTKVIFGNCCGSV